ncbi:MAG: N-6 DNA methylase [Saccharofermentanales bacterium]|jgi:type I restriction enzyme M protein
MQRVKLDELKKVDLSSIEWTLFNALRGELCAPNIVAGAFSLAFVMYSAKLKQKVFPFDVQAFINTEIEDESDRMFVKNSIAFGWENLFAVYDRFSIDQLLAFLIYWNPEDSPFSTVDKTPDSVIEIAINILNIKPNEAVADFGTGLGSFLVEAFNYEQEANYYGNDVDTAAIAMARIRGKLLGDNIEFKQEDMFARKSTQTFDKIFSNYPFGFRPRELREGYVFLEKARDRFPNLSRATSPDWIFNSLILDSLKTEGKAVAIMTNGGTWNSIDKPIREFFIKKGYIEMIIALPSNLFKYTNIPTSMIVLSHGNTEVRMIDATEMFEPGRRYNEINKEQIKQILDLCQHSTEKSKLVSLDTMVKQDYSLSPVRYLSPNMEIRNGVPFHTVIERITRGASIRASELDDLVSIEPTDTQYLMLNNIQDGIIEEDLPFLRSLDKKYEKYFVKNNNLVISKNGAPFKVAVMERAHNHILANGNLFIIELDTSKIDPYYLQAFFTSEAGIAALKSISVGSSIQNISMSALKELIIPLDEMEVQKRIAEKFKIKLDEIAIHKYKHQKALDEIKNVFSFEEV